MATASVARLKPCPSYKAFSAAFRAAGTQTLITHKSNNNVPKRQVFSSS